MRVASAKQKKATEATETAGQPKKKKTDPAEVKQKIKQTIEAKEKTLKDSIQKLKNFSMPKQKPKLGGTEKDLEQAIHDDIVDLQVQLNTDNFGKKAIEADLRKQKRKGVAKAGKGAVPSKQTGSKNKDIDEDSDAPNMFEKRSEESEGDQQIPMFEKDEDDDQGDQNINASFPIKEGTLAPLSDDEEEAVNDPKKPKTRPTQAAQQSTQKSKGS